MIKNYTWYRIKSNGDGQFDFMRFLYRTDMEIGGRDLVLDVWTNVNNPWMYSMQTISKGYWDRYDRISIIEELPPEGEEKAFRKCLKYLFEVGLK